MLSISPEVFLPLNYGYRFHQKRFLLLITVVPETPAPKRFFREFFDHLWAMGCSNKWLLWCSKNHSHASIVCTYDVPSNFNWDALLRCSTGTLEKLLTSSITKVINVTEPARSAVRKLWDSGQNRPIPRVRTRQHYFSNAENRQIFSARS